MSGRRTDASVPEDVEEAGLWPSARALRLQQLGFVYNVHHLSQSFVAQRLHDGSKLQLMEEPDMSIRARPRADQNQGGSEAPPGWACPSPT